MGSQIFNVLSSIVLLAIVTTLVLPGRITASVFTSFFGGFANAIRAGQGR